MRILFVITQNEQGGAGRYVADLAGSLASREHEVFVAAGMPPHSHNGDGWLFRTLRKSPYTVSGFPEDRLIPLKHLVRSIRPIKDFLAYRELRTLIRRLKPDIVHLNSSKAGIIGSFAARGLPTKVVFTAHGFVFAERLSKPTRAFYRFLERRASRYRDAIITVSEADARIAREHTIAPPEKIHPIHNGLNLELYPKLLSREDARQEIGQLIRTEYKLELPPRARFVGTISNLYPTKGIDFLIAAASRIIAGGKHPDAYFIVIGTGPLGRTLREYVRRLGIRNRFFFLGAITEAYRLLRGFDVFTLSSTKEGLPYVLLEAMLAETPIVATRVGGVPEMVNASRPVRDLARTPGASPKDLGEATSKGARGILVPSEDPVTFAYAIEKTLASPRPTAPFPDHFSLPRMVDQTLALYERVVKSPSSS